MKRPSHSDPKPLYRHTYCVGCPGDVWLKWNRGHKWTCEKGHVRIEDVWYTEKQNAPPVAAPAIVQNVSISEAAKNATEQELTTKKNNAPPVAAPAIVQPVQDGATAKNAMVRVTLDQLIMKF